MHGYVKMRAYSFVILLLLPIQIYCEDSFEIDLANTINFLQNSNDNTVNVLKNVRTNLIVARKFHDNLNTRELRNMYACWQNAFREILHLNTEIVDFEKAPISETAFGKIDVEEFARMTEQIEEAAAKKLKTVDVGELVVAVDTLVHLVQTRFQHDRSHADLYANSSITLIKAVTSQDLFEMDATKLTRILLLEMRKLTALIRSEFKVDRKQAHVELFAGGFSNILNVFNCRVALKNLAFQRRIFQHLIESIFEGKKHVKQALAIEAFYFKKHATNLRFYANYTHLSSLKNFKLASTAEIKREFFSQVLLATSSFHNGYVTLLQSLNVRMQNVFRMSHEENLQVLYLNLLQISQDNALDKIIIEAYGNGVGMEYLQKYLRELLIFRQLELLKGYFL